MDAASTIALTSVITSGAVAVAVPFFTFRLSVRQEHTRWLRETRAQLYVELLAEAQAEQHWLELDQADAETRARIMTYSPDQRLPPAERARLAVRANALASRAVRTAFNEVWRAGFLDGMTPYDSAQARVRAAGGIEMLQEAARRELGTLD